MSDKQTKVQPFGNVLVVIEHADGSRSFRRAKNIVTNAGDLHYAQRGAAETPTNAFGTLELGSAGAAPAKTSDRSNMTTKISGSQLAVDGTYPKTNDGDADNTGAETDSVTWRFTYGKGVVVDAAVDRLIITNTSPGASEPVLTYATFTAFGATADDTVKVYVNHNFLGV